MHKHHTTIAQALNARPRMVRDNLTVDNLSKDQVQHLIKELDAAPPQWLVEAREDQARQVAAKKKKKRKQQRGVHEAKRRRAVQVAQQAIAVMDGDPLEVKAAELALDFCELPEVAWQHYLAWVHRSEGRYKRNECIGRSDLRARGWTESHIVRLLGEPDSFAQTRWSMAHLWALERVEAAEQSDEKLKARLEKFAEKKKDSPVDTKVVFTRLPDGNWGLRGHGLVPGATVTVTRRDGATSKKTVGEIVRTDGDYVVATVGRTELSAAS